MRERERERERETGEVLKAKRAYQVRARDQLRMLCSGPRVRTSPASTALSTAGQIPRPPPIKQPHPTPRTARAGCCRPFVCSVCTGVTETEREELADEPHQKSMCAIAWQQPCSTPQEDPQSCCVQAVPESLSEQQILLQSIAQHCCE